MLEEHALYALPILETQWDGLVKVVTAAISCDLHVHADALDTDLKFLCGGFFARGDMDVLTPLHPLLAQPCHSHHGIQTLQPAITFARLPVWAQLVGGLLARILFRLFIISRPARAREDHE